jgi:hypothetical protein
MPKETKVESLSLEARIEWLESAVENLLASVQVRPARGRQVPAETPEPKEGKDSSG